MLIMSVLFTAQAGYVIKDIPQNTHYQIYTITGQLISSGVATSNISTAQLGKGIYILRLENGKAFKFVK